MMIVPTPSAWSALAAELTDGQMKLLFTIEREQAVATDERFDELVRELKRHMPGMAPMITLVAEHVLRQEPEQLGRCCGD